MLHEPLEAHMHMIKTIIDNFNEHEDILTQDDKYARRHLVFINDAFALIYKEYTTSDEITNDVLNLWSNHTISNDISQFSKFAISLFSKFELPIEFILVTCKSEYWRKQFFLKRLLLFSYKEIEVPEPIEENPKSISVKYKWPKEIIRITKDSKYNPLSLKVACLYKLEDCLIDDKLPINSNKNRNNNILNQPRERTVNFITLLSILSKTTDKINSWSNIPKPIKQLILDSIYLRQKYKLTKLFHALYYKNFRLLGAGIRRQPWLINQRAQLAN